MKDRTHTLCLCLPAAVAALAVAPFAGCRHPSPYDHLENWLVREDAARPFVAPSDLFYVQGIPYTNVGEVAKMATYAHEEVGKGRFGGVGRVFSPLVADAEDLEKALEWYFRRQHGGGRPFAFVGEGACGALLKEYEGRHAEELREKGLVASFYTDESHCGFVTDKTVWDVRNALSLRMYREQWGRDMPSGMLGK